MMCILVFLNINNAMISDKVYIKLRGLDLYLTGLNDPLPTFGVREDAEVLSLFETYPGSLNVAIANSSKLQNSATLEDKKLKFDQKYYGSWMQKFKIVRVSCGFRIMNYYDCITYNEKEKILEQKRCNKNDNQIFDIISEESFKKGNTRQKKFMVDLI